MSAGIGDVEIKLMSKEGELETVVLRPTFLALKILSRMQGGIMPSVNRVMQMEFAIFEEVIAVGIGYTQKGREGLGERIFATGLTSLAAPLVRYLHILANAGKPPKDADDTEDGDDPLTEA